MAAKAEDDEVGNRARREGMMIKRAIQFFKEVKVEFSKVSWPSREELMQSTIIVIIVSLLVAAFIGLVDLGLNKLVATILG